MYDRTGTCSTFLFMAVVFIGILVVFTDVENEFSGSKYPKLNFSLIDKSEPSFPDPAKIAEQRSQLWKYVGSLTAVVAVLFIAGFVVQKFAPGQHNDSPPPERDKSHKPELPAYLWGDTDDLIEATGEENILVETLRPDIGSFEYGSIQEAPPAEIEPASEILTIEEPTEDDKSSLPPVDPSAVTYKNLRKMLNPEKENPLSDFLAQRAAVVLDHLAPRTSPIHKPAVLKIVDTTAKARQVLRLVIHEKILNALKDQHSEGKEKYLMGAIGFHMMLFAYEPLSADIEFLVNDKYMGKPYIQIGESTYHLKQQRISASGYHELVSKFKEPVLELYLSTHFTEEILASYQKHFQASKLSQQFGIRETTNANIKKFVESLVDELSACC